MLARIEEEDGHICPLRPPLSRPISKHDTGLDRIEKRRVKEGKEKEKERERSPFQSTDHSTFLPITSLLFISNYPTGK